MKVLIVEDDKLTSNTIADILKPHYILDFAFNGEEAENKVEANDYDIIILDLILPDKNGLEVCKSIREWGIKTCILILSGKSESIDIIKGLDIGADDYLTKPFDPYVLLARTRSLLRRNPNNLHSNILSLGPIVLDVVSGIITVNKEPINLRKKKFLLLEFLMRNPGKVITRGMILEHVWDTESDPLTNTIDVHISYLREKIDKKLGEKIIRTVHGLGYKMDVSKIENNNSKNSNNYNSKKTTNSLI